MSSSLAGAPSKPAGLDPGHTALENGARSDQGELKSERDAPLGGQAVLEGVMMRGVAHWSVAVRKPTAEQLSEGTFSPEEGALGEIETKTFALDSALKRHRVLRLPILRGVVALGGSLMVGFRALEVSANAQLPPEPSAGAGSSAGLSADAPSLAEASENGDRRPGRPRSRRSPGACGWAPWSSRWPSRSSCSS